jgi:biotin synthase-related radical SAM superfamily protein
MAFKALFLAHAPDANYKKHKSIIDTGKYKLITVVVKNQEEAIKVAKDVYQEEIIDAIMLCPGFTHNNVAEIFKALDGKVSVNVSRGDGPSNKISQSLIQKEFFNK